MGDTVRFPSPLWCTVRLSVGMIQYLMQGRTPPAAYHSLISLFCQNGGTSNDLLSQLVSRFYPPYGLEDASGILGDIDGTALSSITRQLDEQGYHVFERRLPPDLCNRLLKFGLVNRCSVRSMSAGGLSGHVRLVDHYDREKPEGVRYDFSAQDVIDNPEVQQLMTDRSIIAVAQSYLRCKPIIDVMSMWWHTAYSKLPDKDAAQFYHFDMDRIKWLKFFIYLTDVGPENGPHCFVKGSHRTAGIPDSLRMKGYTRLTDQEVEACYPRERFIEFTAPRGTVIAEDTRGLHKGKHVISGDRLVLQLQFSNSLFGGVYPKSRFSHCSPELEEGMMRYRRVYSAYL